MESLFVWVVHWESWVALVSLTVLEIVLGVDNILFISILSQNLPRDQREFARRMGLFGALVGRLVVLFFIAWLMSLDEPLFALLGHAFSTRDFILMGGGLFLLWKSTTEIHENLEGPASLGEAEGIAVASFGGVMVQVILLDMVFSLDSVITAIGLVEELAIIVIAIVIAMGVMILMVNSIGRFIEQHPSFKMLALSFLILVGSVLVADGMGFHIPRGYIYFAMAFSAGVEFLNLRMRRARTDSLHLRKQPHAESDPEGQ